MRYFQQINHNVQLSKDLHLRIEFGTHFEFVWGKKNQCLNQHRHHDHDQWYDAERYKKSFSWWLQLWLWYKILVALRFLWILSGHWLISRWAIHIHSTHLYKSTDNWCRAGLKAYKNLYIFVTDNSLDNHLFCTCSVINPKKGDVNFQ